MDCGDDPLAPMEQALRDLQRLMGTLQWTSPLPGETADVRKKTAGDVATSIKLCAAEAGLDGAMRQLSQTISLASPARTNSECGSNMQDFSFRSPPNALSTPDETDRMRSASSEHETPSPFVSSPEPPSIADAQQQRRYPQTDVRSYSNPAPSSARGDRVASKQWKPVLQQRHPQQQQRQEQQRRQQRRSYSGTRTPGRPSTGEVDMLPQDSFGLVDVSARESPASQAKLSPTAASSSRSPSTARQSPKLLEPRSLTFGALGTSGNSGPSSPPSSTTSASKGPRSPATSLASDISYFAPPVPPDTERTAAQAELTLLRATSMLARATGSRATSLASSSSGTELPLSPSIEEELVASGVAKASMEVRALVDLASHAATTCPQCAPLARALSMAAARELESLRAEQSRRSGSCLIRVREVQAAASQGIAILQGTLGRTANNTYDKSWRDVAVAGAKPYGSHMSQAASESKRFCVAIEEKRHLDAACSPVHREDSKAITLQPDLQDKQHLDAACSPIHTDSKATTLQPELRAIFGSMAEDIRQAVKSIRAAKQARSRDQSDA